MDDDQLSMLFVRDVVIVTILCICGLIGVYIITDTQAPPPIPVGGG